MTFWFLAFLAVVWMVVVVPDMVRVRRTTPLPASQRFKRALRQIAPEQKASGRKPRTNAGRWVIVPKDDGRLASPTWPRQQQRRRRVLALLLAIAAGTGIAALVKRGNWVEFHLISDATVAFYVALLLEVKRRRVERVEKVHSLSERRVPGKNHDELLVASGGRRR